VTNLYLINKLNICHFGHKEKHLKKSIYVGYFLGYILSKAGLPTLYCDYKIVLTV